MCPHGSHHTKVRDVVKSLRSHMHAGSHPAPPPHAPPLLSSELASHPGPELREQGVCIASRSSLSSLGQRKEPEDLCVLSGGAYPCTRSSECGGGGFFPTTTPSHPHLAFLFSGPKPGATSKCRLFFFRVPRDCCFSPLLTVYCLGPSWFSLCWGGQML